MSGIQVWDDTPSMEEQFGEVDMRVCTCHPDDNPPVPCQRKYALNDCRLAASSKGPASMREGDGVTKLGEPPAMELIRGPLSRRATSAEFNEWQAREIAAYVDRLTRDRDGWMKIVGDIAALVPIPEVIKVTGTTADLIAWLKEQVRRAAILSATQDGE